MPSMSKVHRLDAWSVAVGGLTLVEHVAERAVVQDHYLAQVWLDRAQILDESSVSECTMLPIITGREEFPLRF